MIEKPLYGIVIIISILIHATGNTGFAQHISFGTYSSNSCIQINNVFTSELQFDNLIAGSYITREILLGGVNDDRVVVMEIVARADYEITVFVDTDDRHSGQDYLLGPENAKIPIELRFAYANRDHINDNLQVSTARTLAVEVSPGFNYITFPMVRLVNGLPGPPPTPGYEGYNVPVTSAFLFFYGQVGPAIGEGVVAGIYTTNINVTVEYSNNYDN